MQSFSRRPGSTSVLLECVKILIERTSQLFGEAFQGSSQD